MNKWIWIFVLLVVVAGGYYYLVGNKAPAQDQAAGPSQNAGLNGSANQGNLGAPDNGTVQQPLADGAEGSIIGANLALGTDSNATLGTYLIAYNGMTVYTRDTDTGTTSTCYDTCARNWPPYVVGPEDNVHNVKAGVTGTVDSILRTDGKAQVTYNGKPLYFYSGDTASRDTTGDGSNKIWHVVKP